MALIDRCAFQAIDGIADQFRDGGAFFFRHGGGQACLVEEDGGVDDEEVIGDGHVANGLGIDRGVEGLEDRSGCADGGVDKSGVGS